MAEITLRDIAHSYNPEAADKTYALNRFDMKWVDGGRYAILGPSGCGKTTMLNIMSGIVRPSEGRLLFDGVDVTDHTTADRNIAQVFQFPVIYGTMTVQDNLAFPLVCRGYDKASIKAKVAGGLGSVEPRRPVDPIGQQADRRPKTAYLAWARSGAGQCGGCADGRAFDRH